MHVRKIEDLRKFCDRYLKDIRNGWELTPRVRLEVMDYYDIDCRTDRPEKAFPLARTDYQKLYLDAVNGALSLRKLDNELNWMPTHVLGEDHPGAWGKIRVSRRKWTKKSPNITSRSRRTAGISL